MKKNLFGGSIQPILKSSTIKFSYIKNRLFHVTCGTSQVSFSGKVISSFHTEPLLEIDRSDWWFQQKDYWSNQPCDPQVLLLLCTFRKVILSPVSYFPMISSA